MGKASSGNPASAQRWIAAIVLGCLIGAVTYVGWDVAGGAASDLDQLWFASRALLAGNDPYRAMSPAVSPWPLIYPMPAVFLAIPFAWLPLPLARACWFGMGTAFLVWAWADGASWRLLGLASGAFVWCAIGANWTPLLIAGIWLPAVRYFWCIKPNLGLLLWIRRPTIVPILGGAILLAISFIVAPHWLTEWLSNIFHPEWGHAYHPIPISLPGGWLLLLALLRWRQPEARVIAAWAMLPSSVMPSELLLGFAIARTRAEWAVVSVASWMVVAYATWVGGATQDPGETPAHAFARWAGHVWPAMLAAWLALLVMVLWRPVRSVGEADVLMPATIDA